MRHPFLCLHLHLIAVFFLLRLLVLTLNFVLFQFMNKSPKMKALNIIPTGSDCLNGRTAVLSVNHAGNFAVLNVQTSSVGYPADFSPIR